MNKNIFLIGMLAVGMSSCTNNAKLEAIAKEKAMVAVKDSLKLDSFKRAELAQQQKMADEKQQAEVLAAKRASNSNYTGNGSQSAGNGGSTTATNKKKGWSEAAKGTAIGAGVGAIGGILIDKKDGRGAIIGGLAGAGAGYAIGRAADRKSGRVQKKNE